jgi:hypothetical protein
MFTRNEQSDTRVTADALSSLRRLGHGYRRSSAVPVSFCLERNT